MQRTSSAAIHALEGNLITTYSKTTFIGGRRIDYGLLLCPDWQNFAKGSADFDFLLGAGIRAN